MNEEQHPSLLARVLSVAFFLVLTFSALTWFFISTFWLISQFLSENPVIGFDKGSMYMLGGGLALLALSVGGIIQGIFGLELTPKKEKIFSRAIIFSLLLMFVFPQLTHYGISKLANERQYAICKGATYRWLFHAKYYFTESTDTCNELVNEKEMRRSSGTNR